MAEFKPRGRWNRQTMRIVLERFKALRHRRGRLTAEIILDDARHNSSPLHGFFEWDDTAAAEKWRLHQARDMMCAVHVNVGTEAEPQYARAMMSVVTGDDEDAERGYHPLTEIRRTPELNEQILARAQSDLEAWLARYEVYEEFLTACELARGALAHLTGLLEVREAAAHG
jgi:hypothetical protein